MLENVNRAHVVHLIKTHYPDNEDRKNKVRQAESGSVGDVGSLLADLETKIPAIRKRLITDYTKLGGRSVHLWTVPVVANLAARRWKDDTYLRPDGLAPPNAYVRTAEPNGADNHLFVVRILRDSTLKTVDGPLEGVGYSDVTVEIDRRPETPRAIVYAGGQHARKALYTVLEDLTGEAIDPKNPGLERILKPVVFTKPQVLALAEKLEMERINFRVVDAEGDGEEVGFYGKAEGGLHQPLDLTKQKYVAQEGAVTVEYDYRNVFAHDDGFPEIGDMFFNLRPLHTSLKSEPASSRPFVRHLINELCIIAGAR